MEAGAGKESQLNTAAYEGMITAEIFVGHLCIPFVRFDQRAVDIERQARATTHRLDQ